MKALLIAIALAPFFGLLVGHRAGDERPTFERGAQVPAALAWLRDRTLSDPIVKAEYARNNAPGTTRPSDR